MGEPALQVPRAQAGQLGQLGDAVPAAGIGVDRVDDAAQRVAGRLPGPQRHAELRLASRPAQEQVQLPGDVQRGRGPRSTSTSASARSIPAVMPAEVQNRPSWT